MGLGFEFTSQADDKNRGPASPPALRGIGEQVPQAIPGTPGGMGQFNAFPGGNETLGQPMYPWLMRWSGPHAAPMNQYENQAMNNMSDFAGSGFGLSGANDYIQQLMGGQWLNPNNQYFDQIEKSGANLLKGQQYDTLKSLASSAAAGGNGLSGARLAAEGRYLNDSNEGFNQMMAELRAKQYAAERGYMQQAPGMAADISQTQMGGLGQLFGMGGVQRGIEDREIQGQYNDWLGQIGRLRDEYRYPDQLATAFLGTNKYPGYQDPKYGNSTADQLLPLLAMLFGGGGSGGGNGLVSFGGGGGQGGSGNKGSGSLLSVGNNTGLLNQLWQALFPGEPPPNWEEAVPEDMSNNNDANPLSYNPAFDDQNDMFGDVWGEDQWSELEEDPFINWNDDEYWEEYQP